MKSFDSARDHCVKKQASRVTRDNLKSLTSGLVTTIEYENLTTTY